ncbi:hypothetical protein [Phorcysia thermohydrogeniphila]|uniref:Uncharacterized protein n=1 Tax=Phorcysia thermohydrogeniphila TaxID=936138 RepID=A0A4R1GB00_9BACT|nr:hypothetical protein [Phorcysia thermohydrogeniphila]TCK03851.1 hypothetical protein CLV27_1164 [Phorcysia thermohydrogeniphila]
MKKFIFSLLFVAFLIFPLTAQATNEDKPVEIWTVEKVENGKRVEVIKVRLESGKIVEIRPHLTKEQIPKPESKLSSGKLERLLEYVGIAIIGLAVGIGVYLLVKK